MAREYASPELANLIAARLSPEEFERRARAPLTDAEIEETAELVAWFTRRYPTAADRLAYARRKLRQYASSRPPVAGTFDFTATAKRLADAHRASDPQTLAVFLDPDPGQKQIRLLEITASAPTLNQPLATELAPRPDLGVPFASAVVLLSPEEWIDVQAGRLELPDGWSVTRLQAV